MAPSLGDFGGGRGRRLVVVDVASLTATRLKGEGHPQGAVRLLIGQLTDPLTGDLVDALDELDHGLIDALVDQRYPRFGTHDTERVLFHDPVTHGGVPFDDEVKGQS